MVNLLFHLCATVLGLHDQVLAVLPVNALLSGGPTWLEKYALSTGPSRSLLQ